MRCATSSATRHVRWRPSRLPIPERADELPDLSQQTLRPVVATLAGPAEGPPMNRLATNDYVLGHTSHELERLVAQGSFFGELTEQVLRAAGLAPGMHVLDVGCGAGDVS